MFSNIVSHIIACIYKCDINHSKWASVVKELNFKFYLSLVNLSLNTTDKRRYMNAQSAHKRAFNTINCLRNAN